MKSNSRMTVVAMLAALPLTAPASAQNFPTKPLRFLTSAAGGGSDLVARLIASALSGSLGQPVIVDNRGGGIVPIEITAKAPADGHTLLYYGSTLWVLPLMQDVPYVALRDFVPITLAVSSPSILTVHPSLPVKTVKELIALAKAKPGALNYGRASAGSSSNLSTALFKSLAGIDMVGIHYKAAGPAMTALLANEIQVFMGGAGGVPAYISSGRMRGLAVGSAKRSAFFPGLPTMAEAGVPGYEYAQTSGVFAPARTPAAIINRLSTEISQIVNRPDIKEKLFAGASEAEGTTPQESLLRIKSEIERLGKVIREANIRGE